MSYKFRWITSCRKYTVQLTDLSWKQMQSECDVAGTVETGGILVGHYTADESTAIITEALPPPRDSARTHTWFHRGILGLSNLLSARWKNPNRTYYIGEWHYHPARIVEPSHADLAQMYAINSDPRYHCQVPIMIIIGQGENGGLRPIRAFVFPCGESFLEFEKYNLMT